MASPEKTERAKKFIGEHTKKLRPLDVASGRAWWDASITGKDEDFKRKEEIQNKIDELLSNAKTFAELKAKMGLPAASQPKQLTEGDKKPDDAKRRAALSAGDDDHK